MTAEEAAAASLADRPSVVARRAKKKDRKLVEFMHVFERVVVESRDADPALISNTTQTTPNHGTADSRS